MEQMKKMPLEGIRVVELATVVAAPTASRVLCAFGAEVIKVETKIGDEMGLHHIHKGLHDGVLDGCRSS